MARQRPYVLLGVISFPLVLLFESFKTCLGSHYLIAVTSTCLTTQHLSGKSNADSEVCAEYAAPLLHNSLFKIASLDLPSILERLMKLSTISLIIWLAGFFAIFQSLLNALAEVMRFGDREFYTEWWNSPSVGTYWRTWNKPVYHFMKLHIYAPLVGRGWSPNAASAGVFIFSGVLHELMVGVPTHNVRLFSE